MAHALVTGLVGSSSAPQITVADPDPSQLARFAGSLVSVTSDNVGALRDADTVVLAIKPQILERVAREIEATLKSTQLIVSIAAGVPMTAMQRWLGDNQPIVRCMPNTPALIGAGITGLVANGNVSEAQKNAAAGVVAAAGEVVWFDDERLLDAVTAVSGSGPAYIFYLLEAMIEAGEEIGLDAASAKQLAIATALGAARMAQASADDPAQLRQNVTSEGGTTERAISILDDGGVKAKVRAAIRGAWNRSRELGQEFGQQ
jgi:pyrroline-5-carboxylate reductase